MAGDYVYEMPWRKNYESYAVAGWVAASAVAMGVNQLTAMPPQPFWWMTGVCGVMAAARLPQAIKLSTLQKHLRGRELSFLTLKDLQKIMKKNPDDMWLGYGFAWENRHVQRSFEILKRDWSVINQMNRSIRSSKKEAPLGQSWIHGAEPEETKIYQPLKHTEGHTLIVGTTGSGKTRLFDNLISQAVLRGETVIIVDPKGDKELKENAKRACAALGKPEKFVSFHPAFPEDSVRIDPLRNCTRITEIASRISALIPSESGGDAFTSFAWQAINNIAQGLRMAHDRPNLVKLRRFLEGGAASLVIRAITAYCEKHLTGWEKDAKAYLAKAKGGTTQNRAIMLSRYYYECVQQEAPSSELEGLLSMFEHDGTHFSKMIASLLPIMNMLTSGELGPLLSPDPDDMSDHRDILDSSKIVDQGLVAYIGLDSLTDSVVGSAIGSMLLSDLTSVAGKRYNFGEDLRHINLFVDEAAETINDPLIQLLNKGRGAKFRLFLATQTYADFTARLGSPEKALQVLGNINNTIALRVIDTETQEYITKGLPMTRVKYVMRTQGQNTHGDEPIMHGGNQGERLMEEESELFPSQLLGMLPNLEFIAKISGGLLIKGRLPILVDAKK
ncbi:conjugative transfer system coupling protein TraD [Halomonas sp. AOP42-D1-22]|uniref:conjugative transfer system coupling protein TraD n=1 Tax=Halomonas sp. AOP42-D1-22 TaxID=3457667 RepID=UPI0040335C17